MDDSIIDLCDSDDDTNKKASFGGFLMLVIPTAFLRITNEDNVS